MPNNQYVLLPRTEPIALASAIQPVSVPAPNWVAPQAPIFVGANGIPAQGYGSLPAIPQYPGTHGYPKYPQYPNTLGDDPIKASFITSNSNPLLHLLTAPYLKHIKETNGEDLPTLEEIKDLLERSSFGLSGFEDEKE